MRCYIHTVSSTMKGKDITNVKLLKYNISRYILNNTIKELEYEIPQSNDNNWLQVPDFANTEYFDVYRVCVCDHDETWIPINIVNHAEKKYCHQMISISS